MEPIYYTGAKVILTNSLYRRTIKNTITTARFNLDLLDRPIGAHQNLQEYCSLLSSTNGPDRIAWLHPQVVSHIL